MCKRTKGCAVAHIIVVEVRDGVACFIHRRIKIFACLPQVNHVEMELTYPTMLQAARAHTPTPLFSKRTSIPQNMKVHIFARGAVPGVDSPILRKSQFYVDGMIKLGQAVMLAPDIYHRPAAQMTGRREEDSSILELLGHGNLLPFTHVQNKMKKPESINYPIPAVGANLWQSRHAFRVSLVNAPAPFEASL